MTVRTLPIWVYLLIVGIMTILILPQINYYLSTMSKLRIECLKHKSEKRRNNSMVRLDRRIDEGYYLWIVLIIYAIVSISFLVENYKVLPDSRYIILQVLIILAAWLVGALIVVVFGVGLMNLLQERAVKDLKRYYEKQFHITVIYLDKIDLEEYYDYKTLEH